MEHVLPIYLQVYITSHYFTVFYWPIVANEYFPVYSLHIQCRRTVSGTNFHIL